MHEILLRGQTRRRGEKVNMRGDKLPGRWVYGGVLQGTGDYSIIYGRDENSEGIEKHTVYTDTLGQYTGLTDKNGVKIFEGDIIERRLLPTKRICTRSAVKFAPNHSAFAINDIDGGPIIEDYLDSITRMEYEIEVIGNIHDNPELTGGGQDDA